MKIQNLLLAGLFSLLAHASFAEPAKAPGAVEQRTVCIEKQDAKTKKMVKQCRQVKIHKKLEGTKVPPK